MTSRDLADLARTLRYLATVADVLATLGPLLPSPPDPADRPGPVPARAVPGHWPDSGPDIVSGTETVVTGPWPPPGVPLMWNVECRTRRGGIAYRGRVRWIDPGTGRSRGRSRTFGTSADAWAWVASVTHPAASDVPRGAGDDVSVPVGRDGSGWPAPRRNRRQSRPDPAKAGRRCAWCREPLPADMRRDAVCCSVYCRKTRWRAFQATGTTTLAPAVNGQRTAHL